MRRFITFWLLIAATLTAAENDQIPSSRKTNWTPGTYTGVIGGIPTNRTHIIDVTQAPYNADSTGATSATAAVQAAIEASAEEDVIYLPPGTYKWDGQINISHYFHKRTIRGAGPTQTFIHLTGSAIFAYVGASDGFPPWENPSSGNTVAAGSSDLYQGSTSFTLADASSFLQDDLIQVRVVNDDNLPVWAANKYPYLRGQIMRVTSVVGNTVHFFPPLYGDLSATAARVNNIRKVVTRVGIEDLRIDCDDSTGNRIITYEQTFGCWIKNVRIRHFANRGVSMSDTLNFEMRKSYIDKARTGGPNHAGMEIGTTSGMLVEDNILYSIFPHFELNARAVGNVIAYNFLEQNEDGGLMGVSIDDNHGAHGGFNLFEGNISSKFQSDGYWGSGSDGTVFRNWIHATNLSPEDPTRATSQFGVAIFLNRFSRRYNVVGNILGRSGETAQKYINVGPDSGLNATSTSSVSIGTGAKTFTVPTGKAYTIYHQVKIWSAADHDKFMVGQVSSYSGSTLTVAVATANGSGSATDWEIRGAMGINYSDRFMVVMGLPNMGNGSFGGIAEHSLGAAHTWAEWPTYLAAADGSGPGGGGGSFQEFDMDVFNTTILKGNYNYATASIPTTESIGSDTLPASLYRGSKPAFMGSLTWPAFDPTSPGTPSYTQIPAGYRYVNGNEDYLGATATPEFSPPAAAYTSEQTVTITCGTSGATIYYTLDGSTPTTASLVYSSPITVSATTTINAYAVKSGLTDSSVASGSFTITTGGGGGGGGGSQVHTIQNLSVGTLHLP